MKEYTPPCWHQAGMPMSHDEFNQLTDSLQYLSPSQLKCLELRIHKLLEIQCSNLLTDEELHMIASLFEQHEVSCQ